MTQFKIGDRVVSRDSGCGGTVMNQILIGGRAWVEWDDGITSNVLTSRLKRSDKQQRVGKLKVGDQVRYKINPSVEGSILEIGDGAKARAFLADWDESLSCWTGAAHLLPVQDGAIKPDYYQFGDVNLREIVQHLSHFGGAAMKYIARTSRIDGVSKGALVEDLDKAIECLQVEKARIEALKPRAEIVRDK